MKLLNYIRDNSIGKDTVLTLVDISKGVYGTDKPNKAQRVSINRAIRNLCGKDGKDGLAEHGLFVAAGNRYVKVICNLHSEKSILLAIKKFYIGFEECFLTVDCDELWDKMDEKDKDLSQHRRHHITTEAMIFNCPERKDEILAEDKERNEAFEAKMRAAFGKSTDEEKEAMAKEIFAQLKSGQLAHTANLNVPEQLSDLVAWLVAL